MITPREVGRFSALACGMSRLRGSRDVARPRLRGAQSRIADPMGRAGAPQRRRQSIGRPGGRPVGGLQEQAGPQAEEAALGLTRAMLAMAAAMKMALKIQIEDGLVRSINWPARIGPVMAAADEAK